MVASHLRKISIRYIYSTFYAFLFIILLMFKKTELLRMRTGICASIDRLIFLKQTARHRCVYTIGIIELLLTLGAHAQRELQ